MKNNIALILSLILLSSCTTSDPIENSINVEPIPEQEVTDEATEKNLTEHNVLFTLNTQEFIFLDESIETVNHVIDIHEEYNVPVDIYLDGVILQSYLDEAPELIERLKSSPLVSVSYHARPPMPYYNEYDWLGLENFSTQELIDLIEDYGTHRMDPTTGETSDEPGSFTYFEEVFGYAPPAAATPTSSTTGSLVVDFFRENGASFIVDNSRDYGWGSKKNDIYIRPEDIEIKLFERTDETPEEIFSELDALNGSNHYFMNIKMHDNDFIAEESAWLAIYLKNKKQNRNQLTPPFKLSDGENRTLLTDAEAKVMWDAYEACVKYASEQTNEYTTWNMHELSQIITQE